MHFPLSMTHMYFMSFFSIEYLSLKVRRFTTTLLILKSSIHIGSLYWLKRKWKYQVVDLVFTHPIVKVLVKHQLIVKTWQPMNYCRFKEFIMTWKAILPSSNLKENWYIKLNLVSWHDKDRILKHWHKDFRKNVPTPHLQWPRVTKMSNLQVSSIHDQNEQQQQQKWLTIITKLEKQQQLKWKRKKLYMKHTTKLKSTKQWNK
jgi:hypothetical protein